MRLTRLVGFLGIVLFCAGQSLFAQSKQERKEQKEKVVREIVDSGCIKIDVDRAGREIRQSYFPLLIGNTW